MSITVVATPTLKPNSFCCPISMWCMEINKYEFPNNNHVKLFWKTNNNESMKDYSWDSTEIVNLYCSWVVLDNSNIPILIPRVESGRIRCAHALLLLYWDREVVSNTSTGVISLGCSVIQNLCSAFNVIALKHIITQKKVKDRRPSNYTYVITFFMSWVIMFSSWNWFSLFLFKICALTALSY